MCYTTMANFALHYLVLFIKHRLTNNINNIILSSRLNLGCIFIQTRMHQKRPMGLIRCLHRYIRYTNGKLK